MGGLSWVGERWTVLTGDRGRSVLPCVNCIRPDFRGRQCCIIRVVFLPCGA